LSEPYIQGGSVVGKDVLKKWQRLFTTDDESTHMGYIKHPGLFPCRQVFLHDPGGILKWLMPTAELG
jgi:hypothetical protein